MKELIVPYDQALELVGLGFKEKCLGVYNREKAFRFNNLHNPRDRSKSAKLAVNNGKVPAPLWQQAFDFLLMNVGQVNRVDYRIEYFSDWSGSYNYGPLSDNLETSFNGRLDLLKLLIDECKK